MARYIDADKLWNDRPQIPSGKNQNYGAGFSECMWGFSKEIKKQIDNPTADVVEVVRCKDCKHLKIINGNQIYAICNKTKYEFLQFKTNIGAHYCSFAEREERGNI